MEEFPKKNCGISTYDKWNFKPQISSIFHFDPVSDGRMAHILSGKINENEMRFRFKEQIGISGPLTLGPT